MEDTKTNKDKNFLVIGAGQMGAGIAQVAAENGYNVKIEDINALLVKKAIKNIYDRWDRAQKKGKREGWEVAGFKKQLNTFDEQDYNSFKFIIEAVSENENIKKEIFSKIGKTASKDAIIGSNTSSISISNLAKSSGMPENFIGIHFMNPVPVMPLVEVIEGDETSQKTTKETMDFVKKINKTPAKSKDNPGFISNKILMPMLNEAIETLASKTGTKEDIDTVMELGMRHPLGPLKLADLIGLDTCLAIMNVLYDGFGDKKYKPSPLLAQKVKENKLGRKTGEGFYKYN